MIDSPPKEFDPDAFRMCFNLLKEYCNDGTVQPRYLLNLAEATGGLFLCKAINKFDYPPCTPGDKCNTCWVREFCLHKHNIKDARASAAWLYSIMEQMPNYIKGLEKSVDKTSTPAINKFIADLEELWKADPPEHE